jgi:SAM-dependent methyltransferase
MAIDNAANWADFDPAAYGKFAAENYDRLHDDLDSAPAARLLTELAGGGRIVEFGIGTGRLALPLAANGLEIHGIEGSAAMADRLRDKPGGQGIPVQIGDFSTASAGEGFALAFLVINTIYALPSQQAQVQCFRNAAQHLHEGGLFLVEAWVPDIGAFRNGTATRPVRVSDGHIELEIATIDPAQQTMQTNKLHVTETGTQLIPANHRYAWPAEMDLMAQIAGMTLAHRWEDWTKTPFTRHSMSHISVWQKT